jgi:hypothetical protein
MFLCLQPKKKRSQWAVPPKETFVLLFFKLYSSHSLILGSLQEKKKKKKKRACFITASSRLSPIATHFIQRGGGKKKRQCGIIHHLFLFFFFYKKRAIKMATLMVARLTAKGFLLSPAAMLGAVVDEGVLEAVLDAVDGAPDDVLVAVAVGGTLVEFAFASTHTIFVSVSIKENGWMKEGRTG